MDFLSVQTLEGKKRVTFHIVMYGQGCGGGGGAHGGEAWKMEADREIIAQRHKSRQKYSSAAEQRRISEAR